MPILLLRCPCCGGRAKQSTYYNVAVDSPLNEDEISIVRCTKCSLRILSGTGKNMLQNNGTNEHLNGLKGELVYAESK